MTALEFWYEFASTYSYPAAARIEEAARAAEVALAWRPFLLGPIFRAHGLADSPFNLFPARGRYMWRDLERLCAAQGLPWRRPSVFPRSSLLAARVALAGTDEDWCGEFTRAVYRANFADDRDIADTAVLAAIIDGLRLPAAAILERAQSPANKERLKEQTADAARRGIFGAPSFTVGDELFWGGDRLDQALTWAARHGQRGR